MMDSVSLLDLLFGALIVALVSLRVTLARLGIPPLVGFLFLGVLLSLADYEWDILTDSGIAVFQFLAGIGVIALLFRVGLESNLHELIAKLPRAAPIWVGNIVISGVPAYFVARYLLDMPQVPSAVVAIALTATSVAVSAELWREMGLLRSPNGELLLDVAGLDDISGIAMIALLFAVLPIMNGDTALLAIDLMTAASWVFLLKASLFGAFCLLFARFGERHISRLLRTLAAPDAVLVIAGVTIAIAALAGQLGFSLAIGGLFAGFLFSRDPDAVRLDTLFEPIYALFAPFFFIGVGLTVDPEALLAASSAGFLLLAVAVLGKVLGAGLPALLSTGPAGAFAIGLSMVPRAEIAMVILVEARRLGDWAVPPEIYNAMVFVSASTCLLVPFAVRFVLQRWPSANGAVGPD